MSNGDYYVGRPEFPVVAPEIKAAQEPKDNGGQRPVGTPRETQDYFVGHPTAASQVKEEPQKATEASSAQHPQQPASNKKGSGFLSKWFPCFAPNGASE